MGIGVHREHMRHILGDNFSKESEPGPDAAINDKRKKSHLSPPRLLQGREH
jgi:hypothetical protein